MSIAEKTLADRIEQRIRKLPCNSNPSYIAVTRETLGDVLAKDLIRWIALEAAAEATDGKMSAD